MELSDFRLSETKRQRINPHARIEMKLKSKCRRARYESMNGICTLIIVGDYFNNRMLVFNLKGSLIREFGLDGQYKESFGPCGVCTIGENLWVVDNRNEQMQIFNQNFNPTNTFAIIGSPPKMICHAGEGKVLVTNTSHGILQLKGDIQQKFGSQGPHSRHFVCTSGICCNSNGEVIVVDSLFNQIQVFNKEGGFLYSLGSLGEGPDQFHYPNGVCTDYEDNIFVADYKNNRISIFTPQGMPIQQVSTCLPTGLCLYKNQIIVLGADDNIYIYIVINFMTSLPFMKTVCLEKESSNLTVTNLLHVQKLSR